jgi:GNAT superfamily N-acetyltransferase
MSDAPIAVRKMTAEDRPFVVSSWFHSAWKGFYLKKGVPFTFFRAGMNAEQERLLERSTVFVAYAKEYPTEILGYSVLGDSCVHWVYVKSAFRRQGIARGLLGKHCTCYTHETSGAGKHLFEGLRLQYNPRAAE